MPLLTAIEPTRRGRFALFADGEFLFSVDGETLANSGLREGDALDDATIALLQKNSDLRRAKDKALGFLSLREYGSAELYSKLCRSFDERTSAAAVAEMGRLALLDDAGYARRRAEGLASRHKSRQEIRAKLSSLGLDRALIEEALEGLGESEIDTIRPLLERQYRARLAAGEREKVIAALCRRGFAGRDARQAVDRFVEEEGFPSFPDCRPDWD